LKIIQYTSRFLKWYILVHNPKSVWGPKFDGLSSTTSTGRKLWRLGKFLNEYEAINKLLDDPNPDQIIFTLSLIAKLSFIPYWFLDNVGYLIRAKFLKYDKKQTTIYAAYGWFIGSACNLLVSSYEFYKIKIKIEKQFKIVKELKIQNKDNSEARKALLLLWVKRWKLIQDSIRYLCDSIVSFQTADLTNQVFGADINDGIIGILGVISGGLNAFQIWNETK